MLSSRRVGGSVGESLVTKGERTEETEPLDFVFPPSVAEGRVYIRLVTSAVGQGIVRCYLDRDPKCGEV